MKPQTDGELGPWLALFCVPHLSLRLKHALLSQLATPTAVLEADSQTLRSFQVKPQAIAAIKEYRVDPQGSVIGKAVTRALSWQQAEPDHFLIHWQHPNYPSLLREIEQPPLVLFVAGNARLLTEPQLAFVGSRNPTADGQRLAHEFARRLSESGLVITSGLALGIDGASHAGALAASEPTLAILATGIDKVYPPRHRQLAQQIRQQGALVSEFPLGHPPTPYSFPQRNRIISGLSLGVLVVEAGLKSGSLITARYALEQNREVFAIPGSIHNPVARGCHQLIRQGAKLVECVEDIVEEIAFLTEPVPTELPENKAGALVDQLDQEQQLILYQLGYRCVAIDTLVEQTGLPVERLAMKLTELTLLGVIEQVEGGFVRVLTGSSELATPLGLG